MRFHPLYTFLSLSLNKNNVKTKLSLHNNRRNGVPQAAFKYKYLQLEQKNRQKAAAGQKVKSFQRFTGNFAQTTRATLHIPHSPSPLLSPFLLLPLSLSLSVSHSLWPFICNCSAHTRQYFVDVPRERKKCRCLGQQNKQNFNFLLATTTATTATTSISEKNLKM